MKEKQSPNIIDECEAEDVDSVDKYEYKFYVSM